MHMLVQTVPDTLTKLAQLGNTTNFEPSGDQPQVEHKRVPYQSRSLDECITNVVNDPTRRTRGLAPAVDTVSLSSRSARALRQGVDGQKRWICHDTGRCFLSLLLYRSALKDALGCVSVRWAQQANATTARGAS